MVVSLTGTERHVHRERGAISVATGASITSASAHLDHVPSASPRPQFRPWSKRFRRSATGTVHLQSSLYYFRPPTHRPSVQYADLHLQLNCTTTSWRDAQLRIVMVSSATSVSPSNTGRHPSERHGLQSGQHTRGVVNIPLPTQTQNHQTTGLSVHITILTGRHDTFIRHHQRQQHSRLCVMHSPSAIRSA